MLLEFSFLIYATYLDFFFINAYRICLFIVYLVIVCEEPFFFWSRCVKNLASIYVYSEVFVVKYLKLDIKT
jgi:hypothetical protein